MRISKKVYGTVYIVQNCPHDCFQKECPTDVYFYEDTLNPDFESQTNTHQEGAQCPETHFQCLDSGYCLPVFLRCNGVYDCPGKEDEGQCDVYTCPGYYRCRGSKICLHPFYVCDGHHQCPQKDDELLCGSSCPQQCECRGFAFMCTKPFTVSEYPGLRYLDASNSGMTPANLTSNRMLVHLDLSHCGFSTMGTLSFPNLQVLDLSNNFITDITTDQVFLSSQIKILILSSNPLISLFVSKMQRSSVMNSVRVVDLSWVMLSELNIDAFSVFPQIYTLNLSFTGLQSVVGSESGVFSKLQALDLRGCPIHSFSKLLFKNLSSLRKLYVDNYKVCCSEVLPVKFNIKHCHGPSDIVSSCDSLLKHAFYQASFVIFTVTGLVCSFVYIVLMITQKHKRKSSVYIIHSHLAVSDFIMGVHLTIVTAADQIYRGNYLWEDTAWRHSITCQVSGFLYVLSAGVSALLTCLMTLDRCVALRCPQRHGRVGTVATHAGCAVVWAGCVLLAAVPLMPGTSLWQLYGQTGVCQPLVALLEGSTSQDYTITVLVGLTLTLLLVTCVAQLYLAMLVLQQSDILTALKSNHDGSYDLTVTRRVSLLLLFDMMCWAWLCLVMLLTSAGVSLSIHVRLSSAMCVLPSKAALDPIMFLAGYLTERQRQTQRQRLFKKLGVTMNP